MYGTLAASAGRNGATAATLDGRMLSVAAWYDNEMGYATRLTETAAYVANAG